MSASYKFSWRHGGKHVLVAGSFPSSSWSGIPMIRSPHDPLLWELNIPLPLNINHQFKFIVDGNWLYDYSLPTVSDSDGNINNWLLLGDDADSGSEVPKSKKQALGQRAISSFSANCVLHFQNEIEKSIAFAVKQLGQELPPGQVLKTLQISKNEGYEFSYPCYEPSKLFKSKPDAVAALLASKIRELNFPIFEKADQGSGEKDKALINIKIPAKVLASSAIGEFYFPPKSTCRDDSFLIEYSSPNTNKPQHLGHVRNNCLGDAISKMLKYQGSKVTTINLINDRGIHICKSMLAYKKFGKGEDPESSGIKGDHLVGDYYVEFDKALADEYNQWLKLPQAQEEFEKWKNSASGKRITEKNEKERKRLENDKEKRDKIPSDFAAFKAEYKDYYTNNFSPIGKECNQMLIDWENNEPKVRELWAKMNGWVFDGFKETYDRFGINHDVWEKESEIYEYGKAIVQKSYEDGILEKLENGAIACDLVDIGVLKKGSGEERKKVLLRANGTSVYITQDIGTAITRLRKYGDEKSLPQLIYVVASEQDRHFQILFKILETLEPRSKGSYFHLSYGMVLLPTGRMKSREGTVVDADNLVDLLVDMALRITEEKWPGLSKEEAKFRAEKIGMAALKFYILAFGPATTITFDPEKSLQFTGKSGPYLLYQYARTRSIFKKAGIDINSITYDTNHLHLLDTEEERTLLRTLYRFPKDVQFACETKDPSKVCDSIYGISQDFNAWYRLKDKHQVVNCTDPNLKLARLMLVLASGNAIKRGLNLLGIETLEQM